MLDAHLDLLDTDIPSKYFACLHNVFKTSSRHVFKTSSRHVFKTSSIRLQCNNFSSSKTSSRRLGRRNVCWVVSNFHNKALMGLAYLLTGELLSNLFDMCDLAAIRGLANSIFHVQNYPGSQKM